MMIIFQVVSVVSTETIFYVVSETSAVSDEIIFHAVLNIDIVSVVSDETISHALSKITVVNNECILV